MANFETIKLDKGLYTTNKGFLAELESVDPSENYKGTSLEGLDAYERQLKRFDIKINGEHSDPVEKFFSTTDSAVLFPEYLSRAVRAGLNGASFLSDIIAAKVTIPGMTYTSVETNCRESESDMLPVAEGEALPETTINVDSNLITLKKRGRLLTASYEAIRFQKIDFFTVMLRQIGAYIARAQVKDALDVLVNGDDNLNDSFVTKTAKSGTLTYADLVDFWNIFDPFEFNTIIAAPDMAATILKMNEMRDAAAGLSFHSSGKAITPLGAKLFKDTGVAKGTLLGLDKSAALEMVQTGDIVTEYDKLIDRQLERATISQIAGFAKIFRNATRVLSTIA